MKSIAVISLFALAAGCAASTEDPSEDVGQQQLPVQMDAMSNQFEIARDGSIASRATGSVEVPIRGANGELQFVEGLALRGTCGLTFISPHYAITAAHCVDATNVPSPTNNPVTVRTYDVTAANPLALLSAGLVKGTFPNYQPLTVPVNAVAGYQSQAFSCKVISRCGFGTHNCDFYADVAMLYCGSRAQNAPWLYVASSDPQTGPVEMYWFHEVLSMPSQQPAPTAPAVEHDRFNHYTLWQQNNYGNNYHYLAGPTNALLPLKSVSWSNYAPRTRLGGNWTDLYGCHGTSGSGVLQRNAAGNLELLGPVATGASSWVGTRLCNDPNTFQQGQPSISYTSQASTKRLESKYSRTLFLDRNPIVAPPGGGIDPGP